MQHLANLDCFFLAKEMDASLAGGFFENFYDYGEGVFRLRFGKQSVLFDLQGFAFVADASFPEPPRQPSSFAMLLRKRFESAKLESVVQSGFDRIFEFSFTSKQYGRHSLVVELFGKRGNLLLLDSERRIVKPFAKVSYAARSLADGVAYVMPPSEKKHPLELKQSDFEGKGRIVSFLSKQTSLAPFYLEEACARAGIALDEDVSALSAAEKSGLLSSFASLFERPSPCIFLKEGKPFAFSSISLKKLGGGSAGGECVAAPSVSQAIASYYASLERAKPEARSGDLEFQLQSQEKAISEFEAKAAELQKAGKWVFENEPAVAELLEAAREKTGGRLAACAKQLGVKARAEKQFLELEKE